MCFCTSSNADGFFSIKEMNSNPASVFVNVTIGDITTQSFFTLGSNDEQIESIFSYGIDKTNTSLSFATERLSFPVIMPLIVTYCSEAFLEYSSADSAAFVESLEPIKMS